MSFTIESAKEGQQPKKPLFLVAITAPDGDVCYLCTSTVAGQQSLTYGGNSYLARIIRADIDNFQAMSPQGIDSVPGFSLTLADGDKFLWANHCIQHGWRGAAITLTAVLWDAVANQYSTDSYTFSFIGGNPQHNHASGQTTVDAISATNFARMKMPSIPASIGRCPWVFPATLEQRVTGLSDQTSINYQCGYSADCSGGAGNLIAKTTLSAAITSATATSCTVTSAGGFPAVPFQATVDGEELNVTAVSGTTLTIARGQHGTVAATHLNGAAFYVPFTTCDYTRSSPSDPSVGCMARLGNKATTSVAIDGDLAHDIAGNATGRFGGLTWIAPSKFNGRAFVSGQNTFGFNQPNPALAGSYFNMVYGTQWVPCAPLAPAGDPNSLRSEVVVCVATDGPAQVVQLVVNGVIVPQDNPDALFTWRYINQGGRDGALNGDAIFSNQPPSQPPYFTAGGDPHGSMCCAEFVVPAQLAQPGSIPNVQALVTGPPLLFCYAIASIASGVVTFTGPNPRCGADLTVKIVGNSNPALNGIWGLTNATYGPPGTVTLNGTSASGSGGAVFFYGGPDLVDTGGDFVSNPDANQNNQAGPACNLVFAYLDLMTWGNITLDQIDPVSWYAAAQIAATMVSYKAGDGSTQTHAQYKASFAIRGDQRQTLAQILTGLRNAGNLMVGPNSTTGLIQCFIKQTLADQQPSAITGSNDSTARSSIHADGTSGTGYYAYLFDETVIEKGSFKVTTTRIESTPNTVNFPFQDEQNGYQQDSLTEIEATSYAYSGNQEVQVPVPIVGVPNFDQGTRVANVQLAEALFGNPRNDPGGTLYFEFMVNQRVLHLAGRLGFICGLTWQSLGIGVSAPQPVRIMSLKPDTDGEHWQVKAAWHQDEWYTYAYGQNPTPFQNNPLLNPPDRPPYPWQPSLLIYGSSDPIWPSGASFALNLDSAQISAAGAVPVNYQPSVKPAAVPLQAATANTGGSIKPGTYLITVTSAGGLGPMSSVITVVVPSGTNTNVITVSNVSWPNTAFASASIYMGTNPMQLSLQESGTWTATARDGNSNPTAFSITGYTTLGAPPPDQIFSQFAMRMTPMVHGGVWGAQVTSVSGTGPQVLSFPGASWTTNQWTGYVLSLYNRPSLSQYGTGSTLDIAVLSNTANTLTVSGLAFSAGDVVVLRAKAASVTSNTIGDGNFINSYAPSGLTINAEAGNMIQIIGGTGAWQPAKVIASNTATVLAITGKWDVTPDATSVYVVVSSSHQDYFSKPLYNDGSAVGAGNVVSAPLPGVAGSFLIHVSTADANGDTFDWRFQPFREIWLPANPQAANAGYYTITPSGGVAVIDLSNGLNQRLVLNATAVNVTAPGYSGGAVSAGDSFTLYLDQDASGGRAVPTFTGGSGAFASDTQSKLQSAMAGTASTRTAIPLTYHGSVWCVDSILSGLSTS